MGFTAEELACSVCEMGDLQISKELDFDIVVVGAGAAGVPAAGWAAELGAKTALLQKEAGIAKWIHHTNSLCDWRADAIPLG